MYALIQDNQVIKYPYTLRDLCSDNHDTSFPTDISDAELEDWSLFAVQLTAPPPFDEATHKLLEASPVLVDQKWTQVWVVEQLSDNERIEKAEQKAAEIRKERDEKLANSDWTQLPDSVVNVQHWAAYRQALRDITNQSVFPWKVLWPAQPED